MAQYSVKEISYGLQTRIPQVIGLSRVVVGNVLKNTFKNIEKMYKLQYLTDFVQKYQFCRMASILWSTSRPQNHEIGWAVCISSETKKEDLSERHCGYSAALLDVVLYCIKFVCLCWCATLNLSRLLIICFCKSRSRKDKLGRVQLFEAHISVVLFLCNWLWTRWTDGAVHTFVYTYGQYKICSTSNTLECRYVVTRHTSSANDNK